MKGAGKVGKERLARMVEAVRHDTFTVFGYRCEGEGCGESFFSIHLFVAWIDYPTCPVCGRHESCTYTGMFDVVRPPWQPGDE